MGAETTVFVKVVKEVVCWIEVSAITLTEAMREARTDPDVIRAISAQYEPPHKNRVSNE